ncbi:MAG: hypothetical protein CVV03_02685 [Firmicutes bacterium HGW-Firmicutes-8]|nr:MAG: hypothetical protein CVV03_02685 [Firmicutes bacterium HGW-Firmicutes-8]
MRKKIIFSVIAAILLLANSAFAVTSSATITSNMTGANGAEYSMTNYIDNSGQNYASSTNTLWVELYRAVDGPDQRVNGSLVAINGSTSWRDTVSTGIYYIHLDPDGPFYTGCNGWGKAVD